MKEQYKILIVSAIAAVILLIAFSIMQLFDSKILELDNKWILVSGIPILIGLFLSGIIKHFKGFGVELETNLAEKVDLDLVGSVESFPSPEIAKSSLYLIEQMSSSQKTRIERLQFEEGKKEYYYGDIVSEYMRRLDGLLYLEIVDNQGGFLGLLPAGNFKKDLGTVTFNNEIRNIDLLITSIEQRSIGDNFDDYITDSISKEDTLLKAFEKFKQSNQGKVSSGDQVLPVLDSKHKMVGLTRRIKLTDKIADQVLRSIK